MDALLAYGRILDGDEAAIHIGGPEKLVECSVVEGEIAFKFG